MVLDIVVDSMVVTIGEALDALKGGRNITYPGLDGYIYYDQEKQAIYRTWNTKEHVSSYFFNGSDLAREDWEIVDWLNSSLINKNHS